MSKWKRSGSPGFATLLTFTLWLCCFQVQASPPPPCELKDGRMAASFHTLGEKTILVLYGGFEQNTAREMATSVRATSRYDEVWLCSGGGLVHEGIALGEALNRAKATVRITQGYRCVSACTIAAMGGYARIIEPDGHFVIHASSSVSGYGPKHTEDQYGNKGLAYRGIFFIDCQQNHYRSSCAEVRALSLDKLHCQSPDDLNKLNTSCGVFDTRNSRYSNDVIQANMKLLPAISTNAVLINTVLDYQMRSAVKSELALLKYYQKMLLDGDTRLINSRTYSRLESSFIPVTVFNLDPKNTYYRDLTLDIQSFLQSIKANSYSQFYAIWELLLTDGELSVKAQLIDYIRQHQVDLGVAGEAAVNIFDAMRTCQIQSLCELERHTAEALGYHNMYDYE